MQPAAVDMARVALLVLLACLACTPSSVSAQDSTFGEEYYSGSGSGSGSASGEGDPTLIDQEREEPTEEEYIVKYVDEEFNICQRYPSGKIDQYSRQWHNMMGYKISVSVIIICGYA